ncbi:hypothetical protein Trydic_g16354 [Trypoxylus dichotomus]
MPKRNEFSSEEHVQIQLLHEISQYAIERFVITRTGRKRITTDRDGRNILRESLKNRRNTSSNLAAELLEGFSKTISARTIRRRLEEAGLEVCKARKGVWLSDKNKKARYEWALKATKASPNKIGQISCSQTNQTFI